MPVIRECVPTMRWIYLNCGLYLIALVFLVWSITAPKNQYSDIPARTQLFELFTYLMPLLLCWLFPLWVFWNLRGNKQYFFVDKYSLFLESFLDLHSHFYLFSPFMTELVKPLPLVRALWEANELLTKSLTKSLI